MGDQDFDLFGFPVDPGTGRPGRPLKQPTSKDRNVIKQMLSEGRTVSEMCVVVGMSEPTFRKRFFSELKQRHAWRLRARAEAMFVLMEEALKNRNMSAMRLLLPQLDRNDHLAAEQSFAAQPKEGAALKVGKKIVDEQKALDADDALMAELDIEAGHARRH